ncbi:50S ribosomal protein L13 [Candidatus Uhrbacteria bacterium CG_4_10_14_0_8_um_filter_58_22]|uniref:Large ribosomal subunit protein uL13 n=1 Tax=Candidatus Uhrbacteria bacterium CG_4_10_14_0_8_um_filter_58_22 TaxID=1975029 RepID=A0A2M7QBW0_9BACT|nr:MAG: 50S ribosomal protein L13 [Parcubacteria group bacterium CG1_02_58_44]PIY63276.1 MAG: 50S ribosomal protein L13 [Candidatus Uhrbacteria bacterium CG_4_10_14_0_8_um_filter_58_22]
MATSINRETVKMDAAGHSIGRLASEAAKLLMGKHKPQYEPQKDMGDIVEIRNAAQVRILGNKLEQKTYYHYSGYPGGMKERTLKEVMAKDPSDAIRRAVKNMLPKNRLQNGRMKRLKVHND